jgi:hypothetical protein
VFTTEGQQNGSIIRGPYDGATSLARCWRDSLDELLCRFGDDTPSQFMVAVSVNPRAKTWIQEVAFDMSDRYLMQKVYDSFPFHLTRRTAHRPVPHVLKVQWNM